MSEQEVGEQGDGKWEGLEMDEERRDGAGDGEQEGKTGACGEEGGIGGDSHGGEGDAEGGLPETTRLEGEIG